MDYVQIITSIGTVVSTVYILKTSLDKKFDRIDKRFDKIEEILRNQDQRISKLEGEVEGMRGMLQTIVGFLLGHKTGTDLK
jgi:hypothetical protein